ncbi:hypothetical protein [Nostoc sp. UCD121]|uniref:hypothetical protein n=1 Tax=Nostoc sp. UCD121 TaxID=2681305 RepID=UPI0016294BAA|nr:hypothetical protein [Nostoc sp. UCD121]MBC1219717.1 hypothetical protein [Nostoc sp. UCD120]
MDDDKAILHKCFIQLRLCGSLRQALRVKLVPCATLTPVPLCRGTCPPEWLTALRLCYSVTLA